MRTHNAKWLLIMLVVMFIALLSCAIAEEEVTIVASGNCGTRSDNHFYGDNLTWQLDSEGTLTISGEGDMWKGGLSPWRDYSELIRNAILDEDITSIGTGAFQSCASLAYVTIPDGVTSIGDYIFQGCSSLIGISIPAGLSYLGGELFDDCNNLRHIVITGDETPKYRLEDIPSLFTIYCYEFSGADYWALSNGYAIDYLDDMDMSMPIDFFLTTQDNILAIGESKTLIPCLFPVQKDPVIQWSSSAPDVVSVTDGVILAHSKGSATITAVCGGKNADITIEAYVPVENFDFPETIWIVTKTTKEIVANVTPSDANAIFAFDWGSETIEVNHHGNTIKITGWYPGNTILKIKEYNSNVERECTIHVCYPVTAIEFEDRNITMFPDVTMQLTASVTTREQNFINKLVTFASSDETVATVDENGLVTAIGSGTATITATAASGIMANCEITVRKPDTMNLPAEVKIIEAEAFIGIDAEKVILPDGCEQIGTQAFANNANLFFVYMPDSVVSIANDAFEGCDNIRFICESENTAAIYATEHNIPYNIE